MLKASTHHHPVSSWPSKSENVPPNTTQLTWASLLQSESEMALEMAVTQAFRGYGSVYVKIRRDPKQMPFAFCQFTVSCASISDIPCHPIPCYLITDISHSVRKMPRMPFATALVISSSVAHAVARKPRLIVSHSPHLDWSMN